MTVLPDAPIDPATGLPVPTIAVATAGGVSVIKDDGTVVGLTKLISGSANASRVVFLEDGGIAWSSRDVNRYIQVLNAIPDADYAGDPDRLYSEGDQPAPGTNLNLLNLYAATHLVDGACAGSDGVTFLAERPDAPEKGMVAYCASTYATGWMPGDIKLAALSDTDDTDLVGSTIYTSDFSSTTDGWTTEGAGSIAAVSSELELTGDGGYNDTARKALTTVAGKRYIIQGKFRRGTGATARVQIQEAFGSFLAKDSAETTSSTLVDFTLEFVAEETAYNLKLVDWTTGGGTHYITDVSVKLADADRSVNNNGLIVNGTVTRTSVATGADLVAYSGFGVGDYLYQPYNADLQFGAGDFCIIGWTVITSGVHYVVDRSREGGGNRIYVICDDNNGRVSFGFPNGAIYSEGLPSIGSWAHIVCLRRSGVRQIFINGLLSAADANNFDFVDNGTEQLFVGTRYSDAQHAQSLALFRISATAPTAEQILKIYNDEKVLFQDNAQATLYGASDAVTALAYDEDTEILMAGTSAGRSDFQGLRRVGNTTTSVSTAISASGGLVVEK
jgi:hypothetical protein